MTAFAPNNGLYIVGKCNWKNWESAKFYVGNVKLESFQQLEKSLECMDSESSKLSWNVFLFTKAFQLRSVLSNSHAKFPASNLQANQLSGFLLPVCPKDVLV